MIVGFTDHIPKEFHDERPGIRENIIQFAIVHGIPSAISGSDYRSGCVAGNFINSTAQGRQHCLNYD